MVKIWPYFHKSIWVAIFFFFQFLCPKNIFFLSFRWGIIPMNFVGFPFRTSKFKNEINYIKYKFSHRFQKVCRWLNIYYSNIIIITFKKITTTSIWIIFKNLVSTCKECNFYQYWAIIACIYPLIDSKIILMLSFQNWKNTTIFTMLWSSKYWIHRPIRGFNFRNLLRTKLNSSYFLLNKFIFVLIK
jgi:hypothetical protein